MNRIDSGGGSCENSAGQIHSGADVGYSCGVRDRYVEGSEVIVRLVGRCQLDVEENEATRRVKLSLAFLRHSSNEKKNGHDERFG